MNARRKSALQLLEAVTDAVILFAVYRLACHIWMSQSPHIYNMATSLRYAVLIPAVTIGYFSLFGLYNVRRRRDQVRSVILGCLATLVTVMLYLYLRHMDDFSRGILVVYTLGAMAALSIKYPVSYWLIRSFQQHRLEKHVLVIGTGALAREYAEDVRRQKPSYTDDKIVIDGFLGPDADFPGRIGGYDRLETLIESPDVDEVVCALDREESDQIYPTIRCCEHQGTRISVIPFYNDILPANPAIETIGRSKLINLRSNPLDNPVNAFLKRFCDIALSLALLVVLAPFFLVLALVIRLTSPGPVLFKQERVGRHKKHFIMYKFRSMRVNAEQDTAWTTNEDARRTGVGRLMRKLSIDELPQLFNVLKGDMSLVGPRPEIPYYIDQYKDTVPLYMLKHQVRPGMTGWAQVNGWRGDTSIPIRIEHDIWYIEHWTLRLDARILLRTALGGFINQEALQPKGNGG